jgi:hypothetical protein
MSTKLRNFIVLAREISNSVLRFHNVNLRLAQKLAAID